MKLDILMKLIALANNNPNDNEANLAARKVCKAIGEGKFTITEGIQRTKEPDFKSTPPNTRPRQPNTGRDPFWDFVDFDFGRRGRGPFSEGQYTTGGRRAGKNTEQQYRERQQSEQRYKPKSDELKEREHSWLYEYYVTATDQFYNPITQKYYKQMFQDLWFQETGTRHHSDTAAFRAEANFGKQQDEGNYGGKQYTKKDREDYYKRKANDIRRLRCKTCRQVFNTKFVGLEELFECNECQYTAYQRTKEPEAPKHTSNFQRCCLDCKTPVSCIGDNYCAKKGRSI